MKYEIMRLSSQILSGVSIMVLRGKGKKRAPRRPVLRRPLMARRRKPVGRAMIKRSSDYAKVVESAENVLTLGATGEYSYNYTTSLSEFQRAQEVAHAYKYYRCAKIELQFVPYANVVQVNAAAAGRLPQLYFTIDRVSNQWITPTEAEMLERGISPKLFKRKFNYSWKPNLLQNVQMEVNQPADGTGAPLGINVLNAINSVPLFNKWLPTQQSYGYKPGAVPDAQIGQTVVQPSANPYALRYYGAAFCISIEGGGAIAVGDLISKVTWEFKGPRALKTNAPGPQVIVSPATSMMTPGVVANSQPTDYP